MRKLLLRTATLSVLATLPYSLAVADVAINGSMEFHYVSKDPGTTVSGASNDYFHNDSKVELGFSNKTDTGLNISMYQTLRTNNNSNVDSDASYMTVEGNFGYIGLGNSGGIGDELTPTAADLIGPGSTDAKAPQFYSSTGSLTSQQASLINIIDNENNITYKLPSINGLTVGASYKDAGDDASANADETVFAGSYEMVSGNLTGTLAYATNSIGGATAGAGSTNSSSIGVTLSSGPFTVIIAQAEDDQSTSITTEVNDYGFSYAVDDALTLAVTGTEVSETQGSETLDVTSISAKYTIASGLDSYITYHDYDYKAGTSGATSDDGSAILVSLEATF
jgi:hypothetical protein